MRGLRGTVADARLIACWSGIQILGTINHSREDNIFQVVSMIDIDKLPFISYCIQVVQNTYFVHNDVAKFKISKHLNNFYPNILGWIIWYV